MIPHSLSFHGAQGLATIEEACRRLLSSLAATDHLDIDLGGVEAADLAFLQVIVAVRTSARASGKTLFWRAGETAPVVVAMRRAGLNFDLEGPEGAGR